MQARNVELRSRQTLSCVDPYRPLLAGLAAALLAWAFIQISIEMLEGDTRGFDTAILHAAQSLRSGHPWVTEVMRDLSGLGSTSVLTLFTVIAGGSVKVKVCVAVQPLASVAMTV